MIFTRLIALFAGMGFLVALETAGYWLVTSKGKLPESITNFAVITGMIAAFASLFALMFEFPPPGAKVAEAKPKEFYATWMVNYEAFIPPTKSKEAENSGAAKAL